jgi:patatin-like phospholipase/acyl hydrolase
LPINTGVHVLGEQDAVTSEAYSQSVLTFDGQDDYIDFGKNDLGGVFAEGSSAFTISGWINPQELKSRATTYGTRNVFFARSSDRYSDNFEFGISEEGNLDVYIDEKIDNVIKTLGDRELTVGQWHFFAIVFNRGQLTVYLDGNRYTESLRGDSLNRASSSVTLGATLHNHIYFKGQLAHISVWNYPCSQAEIQRHRHQPLVGNEEGLVAYWILNEGEGVTIRDQTDNGHNGKLRGNPSWSIAQLPFAITPLEQDQRSAAQSSNEGNKLDPTASSSQENPLTETTVLQEEDSPTEAAPDSLPVSPLPKDERQPKGKKETRRDSKKSSNTQTSIDQQIEVEQFNTAQPTQSEVLVNIQQHEPSETLTQTQADTTMSTPANSKYKILAIDGGGIRGIIPALILAEIEKRTQKQIFSLFDLIAGTSTGGILALGLTKPRLDLAEERDNGPAAQYSAEELVKIFVEYGAEIFYEPLFEKILGPIEDIFIQPKYASDGREEIFRQYFGDTLLEKNLKEVLVTSYDIEQRIPVLFTNNLAKQQTESRKLRKLCTGFTLTDVALATSATPTYFAPHRIPTTHNTNGFYTLVDGALVANNPTSLAIMEAQISRQENQQVLNTEDILVVSLGTGSVTNAYPYNEVKNWGLLQWGRPLLNIVFDGGSEVVAGELERLFESNSKGTKNYYRFQTFLTGELEALDNVKLENVRELQAVAYRLISKQSQTIDELCSLLSN